MKIHRIVLVVTLLFLPMLLFGQQEDRSRDSLPGGSEPLDRQGPIAEQSFPRPVRAASEIARYPVVDGDGRWIGQAEDLLLGLGNGWVPYGVFSFSGFDGFGDGLVPVPLRYLQFFPEADTYLVTVDQREVLRQAPTLSELAPEEREPALSRYWSTHVPRRTLGLPPGEPAPKTPFWLGGARVLPEATALLSEMVGRPVDSLAGTSAGEITDFAVDLSSGRIPYTMLDPASEFEPHDQWVLMPLSALSLNTRDDSVFVEADPDQLQAAPSFSPGRRVDFNSPTLRTRVQDFWFDVSPAAAMRSGLRILPGVAVRATVLTGTRVVNRDGADLGTITDLVIARNGHVPYAAVEYGGNWYYIPIGAFLLDRMNRLAVMDLQPGRLEDMPEFPIGTLPDTSQPGWDLDIRAFWERELTPAAQQLADRLLQMLMEQEPPVEEAPSAPTAHLASVLMEYDVQSPEGENLGSVADLLIDVEAAELAYPVLSVGGFLGLEEKLLPVPPKRMTIDADRQVFILSAEREVLQEAPGFTLPDWPDTRGRRWAETFESFWARHPAANSG